LRPVYLGDDLFACQPIAAMVKDNGGDFIFTAKECEWLSESAQRWRSVNGGQDRYQIRRRV
jgi:hypothetical protein